MAAEETAGLIKFDWSIRGSDYGYRLSLDGHVFRMNDIRRMTEAISFSDKNTYDLTGLGILWRDGKVFIDHATREYGMSRAILGAGFSLDCLLYKYQRMDWSDPANWDQNGNAPPLRQGTYDGISIHPFEVVFHK